MRIAFLPDPAPELRNIILEGVRGFNRTMFANSAPSKDIAVVLYDANDAPVGGLWGRIAGQWLAIELIFVPEEMRGAGAASRLLAVAETEASRRGCRGAWLDTLNPGARRLYLAQGYRQFGELEDYAEGSSRYFLRKDLTVSRS